MNSNRETFEVVDVILMPIDALAVDLRCEHSTNDRLITLVFMEIMVLMRITTISIPEGLRRELLRIAAELQAKRGERVGYDEVIQYLISRATRREDLLWRACVPISASQEELRRELRSGRREDKEREKALEERFA